MLKIYMISETHVRTAVALWLRREGYGILDPKEKAQHGPDIRARHIKYPRYFIVEVKGDPGKKTKNPDSSRTVVFWTAIGQIVTRMNTVATYYYGIAFPNSYRNKIKNLPWQFSRKNKLHVFLVDKNKKVERLGWNKLKALQQKSDIL